MSFFTVHSEERSSPARFYVIYGSIINIKVQKTEQRNYTGRESLGGIKVWLTALTSETRYSLFQEGGLLFQSVSFTFLLLKGGKRTPTSSPSTDSAFHCSVHSLRPRTLSANVHLRRARTVPAESWVCVFARPTRRFERRTVGFHHAGKKKDQ